MPRKKQNASGIPIKRIVPEPEPNIIGEDEVLREPTPEEIQDAEKLSELQSRFGGQQYKIRIEKYNKETSEMEIVDRVALDNFDPFLIGKLYKGGRFVCKLYNDKGKYVEGGYMTFNFAEKKEEEKPSSPLQDPLVLLFIENLKSQLAQQMELLKAVMTGEKQSPISEIIGAVKGIHDMAPKDKQESPFKNLKELLELQALVKESTGDVESGDNKEGIKGIFSEAVEALKILNQTRGVPGPRALKPGLSGPLVIKRPPAPEPKPKEEIVSDPVLKKLLPHIPIFEEAASNSEPTEKWGGYLIDVLDTQVIPALLKRFDGMIDEDGIWERLIAASEDDSKIQKIYEYAPSLEPYRDWVLSIIKEAVKQFDANGDDLEEPEVSAGTTVNGANEPHDSE